MGKRGKSTCMKSLWIVTLLLCLVGMGSALQQGTAPARATYKVTVIVEGVNEKDGNIEVLLFNSAKGWR